MAKRDIQKVPITAPNSVLRRGEMRSSVTMRFAFVLFIALLPLCSAQGVGGPPKDLIKAIDSNNPALVNVALKSFGKVNAKGEDGDTALMRACRNGRYKAVKALIKGKADATIPDAQGKTVMHVAAEAKDAGRTLQALLPPRPRCGFEAEQLSWC